MFINRSGAEIIDFSEADDEENEDDVSGLTCHNNYGSKRVIEALQTCPWKDLECKSHLDKLFSNRKARITYRWSRKNLACLVELNLIT